MSAVFAGLDVSWTAPDVTGMTAVTDYDVQYRPVTTVASAWTDHSHSGTATTAAISGLTGAAEYEVRVRAVNAEGPGVWSGAVSGTALDNRAPVLPDGPVGRQVAENAGTNAIVGDPVTASDPDSGDSVSYELAATGDHASFTINSGSGQITANSPLDHETKDSYQVTVTATDDGTGSLSDSVTVNISVIDVNEAPEFAAGSVTLTVAENAGTNAVVGDPVTAVDPDDGDTVTYSLPSGAVGDHADFTIDARSGQITARSGLDHEAKDSYSFTGDRHRRQSVRHGDGEYQCD